MCHLYRLAGLVLALLPATALAQIKPYYHNGAWEAFSGRTETGSAVCGLDSIGDDRKLAMRFTIGGTETVFTASKPSWSIPEGTKIPVVIQIGLSTPWSFTGTGHGSDIDWSLDADPAANFRQQFRTATSLTVTFPIGSEPPWTLSLAGSTAISETFDRCVHDLTQQVRSQTPPPAAAAPAAPTQPFAPPPAH